MNHTACLLIQCSDQEGLLAQICNFIFYNKGNITSLQEYVDEEEDRFFARVEWDWDNFSLDEAAFSEAFETRLAQPFGMQYQLFLPGAKMKMAVFVSKYSHCLEEIMYRVISREWDVEISCIISNHEDLSYLGQRYEIPFYYMPVTKKTKSEVEKKQLEILAKHDVDFIALARYMQILSPDFTQVYADRIINIHHSFLPAFVGAKPYHAAYRRGVKIIGATAHFVTSDLDAGPIIVQDVTHISHRDSLKNLITRGRDVEKKVFAEAIKVYLEHRVLSYQNRTVVFH